MNAAHTHVALNVVAGAILIEGVHGRLLSGDSVVIDIPTTSKYPCILSWTKSKGVTGWSNGFEGNEIPGIILAADDKTLSLDPSQDPVASTVVTFPDYAGWHVVSAEAKRRAVSVTLYKNWPLNEESEQAQLPESHPLVKAAQAFSSDPMRQADFLAGAMHASVTTKTMEAYEASLKERKNEN